LHNAAFWLQLGYIEVKHLRSRNCNCTA